MFSKTSEHRGKKGDNSKSNQNATFSDKQRLIEEKMRQLRHDLQKYVDEMLREADRKVGGMNSELRFVRRDMERTMGDGKKEIQQYKQMVARESHKLLETMNNNERYYQRKNDELLAVKQAKKVQIEEAEKLPKHKCVVCYEKFSEAEMFGCKPVLTLAKKEEEPVQVENLPVAARLFPSSPDSSSDEDILHEQPPLTNPRRIHEQLMFRHPRRVALRMWSPPPPDIGSSDDEESDAFAKSESDSDSEPESHFICSDCCKGYAKSKVAEGALVAEELGLPCANNKCKRVLLWGPMSRILDEETLKPLEARLATSALQGIDGIEFCKSCYYGMQIEGQEQKFFSCQNKDCRAVFCRTCQVDYDKHRDKTCEAADPTRILKTLEEFLSAAKFRVCPKCTIRFTKDNDSTCNQMTCRCGTTMCYICKTSPVTHDHFGKPCRLFTNTDETDKINLDLAIAEARKDNRFERLLPLLVKKRENFTDLVSEEEAE